MFKSCGEFLIMPKKIVVLVCFIVVSVIHGAPFAIVLNGTSSAGKSSNALELKKILGDSWVIIGWDVARESLYRSRCEGVGFIDASLSFEQKQKRLQDFFGLSENKQEQMIGSISKDAIRNHLRTSIKKLFDEGYNLIVDVIQSQDGHDGTIYFLRQQKNVNLFLVLNYCSFDVLVQHVCERNSSGNRLERRSIEIVAEQFCSLYGPVRSKKQIALDVICKQDIKKVFTASLFEKYEHKIVNKLCNDFIRVFFTHENKVQITSYIDYDMVVNTGKYRSQQCAKQIKDKFELHLIKSNKKFRKLIATVVAWFND